MEVYLMLRMAEKVSFQISQILHVQWHNGLLSNHLIKENWLEKSR
jgi:hypothetical protein